MNNRNIEAIYPLSPQQQGMLFESLAAPEAGIFVEQHAYEFKGLLNLHAFRQAWQSLVERHSVLRTAFVWKNVDGPLQVVLKNVEVPLQQNDWRDLSVTAQHTWLEQYLHADSRRSFELTKAPLIRLALIRTGETTYHFVWTLHHILMDGWCFPIIVNEFSSTYEALCKGQEIQPGPGSSYRDYIAWLKRQDFQEAEAYWRKTLAGFTDPVPLGRDEQPAPSEQRYLNHEVRLTTEVTSALQIIARRNRLTLNTVVQAVWALLLSRYSGCRDVVFGTTVSGRPPELEGVETMVGLFINTLPFRVEVPSDGPLWSWLEELQSKHLELRRYEYCSAGQVHQWSDMPGTLPLYESLLVYENYPSGIVTQERSEVNGHNSAYKFTGARTAHPLTILISTQAELVINVIADGRRLDKTGVSWIANHYLALLTAIAFDPAPDVATLLEQIPDNEIPAFRALPKNESRSVNGNFVGPQTETEEILARLAAEVLGLPKISTGANFLSLGGHSLLVTQLRSRIRDAFHIELPLRQIFEAPTVAGLAQSIDAICWATRAPRISQTGSDYEEGEI